MLLLGTFKPGSGISAIFAPSENTQLVAGMLEIGSNKEQSEILK